MSMATAMKKQRKKVQFPEILPKCKSDSMPISVKAKRPPKQPNKVAEEIYCSICLNTQDYKQNKSVSCCHVFHTRCINKWLKSSNICPICKVEITNTSKRTSDVSMISNRINANVESLYYDTSFPEFTDSNSYTQIARKNQRNKLQPRDILPRNRESDSIRPVVKAKRPQKQQNKVTGEINCSICLNTQNYRQHKAVSCCHVFHTRCINKWLKSSNICPICKTEITNTTNRPSDVLPISNRINVNVELSDSDSTFSESSYSASNTQLTIKKQRKNVQSHEILKWKRKSDSIQLAVNAERPQKQQNKVAEIYCSICLNTENYRQLKAVSCCHVFHTRCINKWLKSSNLCPICKTEIASTSKKPDVYMDSNSINVDAEYSDYDSSLSEFSDSGSLESEPSGSGSSDFYSDSDFPIDDSPVSDVTIMNITNCTFALSGRGGSSLD